MFRFEGEPLPSRIDTVLVANADAADASLHTILSMLVPSSGRRSMVSVARKDLVTALTAAESIPDDHPLFALLGDAELDAALEEFSYGSEAGIRRLRSRAARRISASDLNKARTNADRIGRDGEGLVHIHLRRLAASGDLSEVVWEADENAAAPFDFMVQTSSGRKVKIDAKSTSGPFERTIHISAAEIAEAAESHERYDLYRVFEITEDDAKLRTTKDIMGFAVEVIDSLEHLPAGIRPDSFSVATSCFEWGPVVSIERPSDPEYGD